MRTHAVPYDVFDQLAAGDGDTQGALRAGQRSKRLLLIHEVVAQSRSKSPDVYASADTASAVALLADAQRRAPHAVDDLLLHPQVGAWATHCLTSLAGEGGIADDDLGHLGAIAAAAALRAGRGFRVRTYLRDGAVMFPTFGMARLPAGRAWAEVRSRPGADGVEISTPDTTTSIPFARVGGLFLPLRRLASSAGGVDMAIDLDDLDPYRSSDVLAITDRLSDSEVAEWRASFDEAWEVLVSDHPASAVAISAGIASVVPLRSTEEDSQLSATLHRAIGAVAMTTPEQPLNMALALLHEYQHTKLSALLDLVPLVERPITGRFYSPWRRDPRPPSGLLQGTYAFLGLARFWDVHRGSAGVGPDSALAQFEFALCRDQVRHGMATLREPGVLEPSGARFVDGMHRRLDQLAARPVPAEALDLARIARFDHRTSWRLRNVHVDPDHIERDVSAWLAGRARPAPGPLPADVRDGGGPMPSDVRFELLRRRAALPSCWRTGEGDSADVMLVDGRVARAADAYSGQITSNPDDLANWAGLSLARRLLGTPSALTAQPERVYALHRAIRSRRDDAPGPDELAAWLG